MSPFNPSGAAFQAGRIMLERITQLLDKSLSFSFETTLSGLSYLPLIRKAKEKGYGITLFFVYLSSPALAIERVAIRVSKGGHSIPSDVIRRRYHKGLSNFSRFATEVNGWYIYDNSGTGYELIAKKINNLQEVIKFELYNTIINNEKAG